MSEDQQTPDWLQDLANHQKSLEEQPPDWLKDLANHQSQMEQQTPDWLQDMANHQHQANQENSDWSHGQSDTSIDNSSAGASVTKVETFEDVFRAAYVIFANIMKRRSDSTHEVVENPDLIEMNRDDCYDFLYRIGQPNPKSTFQLSQEIYTCNALYDDVCNFGIDTKKQTARFRSLLSIINIVTSITSSFLSSSVRGYKGDMTKIILGEVQGNGKSSIRTKLATSFDTDDQSQSFFQSHPETFFTTETTLELVNSQSKQWCKDILIHATNIISIMGRQFAGSKFTITFEDPSPTHLTIKFLGNDIDEIIKMNIIFFLNEITNAIFPDGFNTEWKWAVSFEEFLTIPIGDLLHTEVALSLPALGIRREYLQALPSLIPLSKLKVETFDELTAKIPGLSDIANGNLTTTLDLRGFVSGIIGSALGGTDKLQSTTLLHLLVQFAPIAFTAITPLLSPNLTLKDVLSAFQSLAALGRLIFARDFNNFTSFSLKCTSGHSFSFESDNVFKVDAFFHALDQLFAELGSIVDNYEASKTQ